MSPSLPVYGKTISTIHQHFKLFNLTQTHAAHMMTYTEGSLYVTVTSTPLTNITPISSELRFGLPDSYMPLIWKTCYLVKCPVPENMENKFVIF